MSTANGGPVGIPGPPLPKKVPLPFNYTFTMLTALKNKVLVALTVSFLMATGAHADG